MVFGNKLHVKITTEYYFWTISGVYVRILCTKVQGFCSRDDEVEAYLLVHEVGSQANVVLGRINHISTIQ